MSQPDLSRARVAYVDQDYTGEQVTQDAAGHVIELHVVKCPETKRNFVLLPRLGIVERDFAWASRFRRLDKDDKQLPSILAAERSLILAHYSSSSIVGLSRPSLGLCWLGLLIPVRDDQIKSPVPTYAARQ